MIELPSTWPGLMATAEAEKQEPDDLTIAYMSGLHDGKKNRTWVGLTPTDWFEALKDIDPETKRLPQGFSLFACAIEAKLKEKNT